MCGQQGFKKKFILFTEDATFVEIHSSELSWMKREGCVLKHGLLYIKTVSSSEKFSFDRILVTWSVKSQLFSDSSILNKQTVRAEVVNWSWVSCSWLIFQEILSVRILPWFVLSQWAMWHDKKTKLKINDIDRRFAVRLNCANCVLSI